MGISKGFSRLQPFVINSNDNNSSCTSSGGSCCRRSQGGAEIGSEPRHACPLFILHDPVAHSWLKCPGPAKGSRHTCPLSPSKKWRRRCARPCVRARIRCLITQAKWRSGRKRVARSGSTDASQNNKKWSQQHYVRPQFLCGTRASKRFPPYKVGLCYGLKEI